MDARRRATERGAEADDPHAEAKLLVQRVRAGELPREHVLLLAYAGHPGLAPQFDEELAEWAGFKQVEGSIDIALGLPPTPHSLADWLLGLARFHADHALRAMAVAIQQVGEQVRALTPDANVTHPYYAEEFDYEKESASQVINAALLAFMNWSATGATPLLGSELRRASEQATWFPGTATPAEFAGLFEVAADCASWNELLFEKDGVERVRLQLQGWTALLVALGVDLTAVLALAQASLVNHLRSVL